MFTLPRVIQPTALGLFVGLSGQSLLSSGCGENNSSSARSVEAMAPPLEQNPPPVLRNPTVIPEEKAAPPIELQLEGHPLAKSTYAALQSAGVKLEALDKGCNDRDGKLTGKGDHKVQPCEVYEFALDNDREYSSAARVIAGEPLPWKVNIWVPPSITIPAYTTAVKINSTIDYAVSLLKREGVSSDSPEFKEKLAFALFYFAAFPEKVKMSGGAKKLWLERTKKLRFLGLHDFQDHLFKNGGLGLSAFRNRGSVEKVFPAEEALEKKSGMDNNKSQILFALFRAAGLDPFFTEVALKYADPKEFEKVSHGPGVTRHKKRYLAVGVPLGPTYQLFHPDQMVDLSALTPNRRFPSLRHYLAYHYDESGGYLLYHSQSLSTARETFSTSIELWPENPAAYNGFALTLWKLKDLEGAETAFLDGLKYDPNHAFLNSNYASLLKREKKAKPVDLVKYYYRYVMNANLKYSDDYTRDECRGSAKAVLADSSSDSEAKSQANEILIKLGDKQETIIE